MICTIWAATTNCYSALEVDRTTKDSRRPSVPLLLTAMVSALESFGQSLIEAVKEDDVDLAKMLLARGAPTDAVDEFGYTALHWAALYNKPEYAHALLTLGLQPLNIDILDKDGYTALQLGIKQGHKDITQLLVTYGADLNGNQQNLPSPVELAEQRGFGEILSVLHSAQQNQQILSTQIPKSWKLGQLLGCGGFGKVFIGQDLDRDREIAIKIVTTDRNRSLMSVEATCVDSEVKVLRNLSHKYIVRYYGMQLIKSSIYIFMEYMPGGSLHDYVLRQGGLDEDKVRSYCHQILDGIAYLHGNMVIHRDIKGANILLTADYVYAKLGDFGLSQRLQRQSTTKGLNAILGSPYWMAPEVVTASSYKGEGYGRKADIWSTGCTIIEMLTCKPPWSEMEPMSAVYNIGSGRKSPEIPQNVSIGLKDLLLQTFKRDPRNRPSARDLLSHPFITNEEESLTTQANNRIRRSLARINHRLSETFERASSDYFAETRKAKLFIPFAVLCVLVSLVVAVVLRT